MELRNVYTFIRAAELKIISRCMAWSNRYSCPGLIWAQGTSQRNIQKY